MPTPLPTPAEIAKQLLTQCRTAREKDSASNKRMSQKDALYAACHYSNFLKLDDLKKETVGCPTCHGRGWTKDFTGVGNDYNEEKCETCQGKRTVPSKLVKDYIAELIRKSKDARVKISRDYKKRVAVIKSLLRNGTLAKLNAANLSVSIPRFP